jgi:hypothetical protein
MYSIADCETEKALLTSSAVSRETVVYELIVRLRQKAS